MLPRLIHVPTPNDRYSPATGSAIMTVIHGISVEGAKVGDVGTVVVAKDATSPHYDSADIVEYAGPNPIAGIRRRADWLAGALWMGRPGGRQFWKAALDTAAAAAADEDFIICHNAPEAARVLAHPNLVLYAHNDLFRTYSTHEMDRALAGFKKIVCVSDYIARGIAARAPRHKSKILSVLNGVEAGRFDRPPVRRTTRVLRVLFVGRVIESKGAHVVISAMRQSLRRDIELTVVGSASFSASEPLSKYERRLRSLAEPLAARVKFVPFQDRIAVPAFYSKADVFVVPSTFQDPCPLTVLEGMGSGLATVISRVGGAPELGADATPAFSAGDVNALSAILDGLAEDESERFAVAQHCYKRARDLTTQRQYSDLRLALS